jgi:hypothetical protein
MISLIKELLFDKDVVDAIKQTKINEARLYNLLFSGKITMKEYVHAVQN